tara:strand:- start:595 stop:1560 length:966 start_codon:yes stop_codon:yes gene_type:complete
MSGGSKVQTTRTEPWEQQKPYLERGFEYTTDLYRGGKLNPAYYPGQTVAGFTAPQTAAQEATLRYATDPQTEALMGTAQTGLGSTLGYGQGAMGYGAGAAGPLSQSQYAGMTPFTESQYGGLMAGDVNTDVFGPLADAYRNEAMSQLTGEVLPGIRQEIVRTQPGGGTRGDIVQANAVAAAQQRISDNLARAEFDAYGQAQNRRMQAAQMGMGAQQQAMGYGMQGAGATQAGLSQYPSILGAPLAMTGAVGAVGGQQQAMNQQMLDAAKQEYAYNVQRPQLGLQNYMAGISGEYGGTSEGVGPAGPNPLITALTTAAMMAI